MKEKSLLTNSILEYINKNQARKMIRCKFSNDSITYLYNGEWIDQIEYNKIFPVYEFVKFNWKGENKDGTHIK